MPSTFSNAARFGLQFSVGKSGLGCDCVLGWGRSLAARGSKGSPRFSLPASLAKFRKHQAVDSTMSEALSSSNAKLPTPKGPKGAPRFGAGYPSGGSNSEGRPLKPICLGGVYLSCQCSFLSCKQWRF